MPSKSLKQHNLFKKVAASKDFAEKVGIKQSVAREFLRADKKAGKYQYPVESTEHKGWYVVEGYPYFLVNKEGKIKNAKTGYETFGSLDDKGYRRVCQWDNKSQTKKEYKAHHIVCTAFHGPCPGQEYEVGHKDDDRANNRPTNLHWTTRKDNMTKANQKRVSAESAALENAYVGRVPNDASIKILQDLQRRLGLENPIPAKDLHITLLYSPEHPLENYTAPRDALVSYGGWKLLSLDEGRVVAIELLHDQPLKARHAELLEMGGVHTYPSLLAHISLSYNDQVHPDVADRIDWDVKRKLTFIKEYLEPIEETPEVAMESALPKEAPASLSW